MQECFLDLQSHPASLTTGAGNLLIVKVTAEIWNSMSFTSTAGSGKNIFTEKVMDRMTLS